MIAHNLPNIGTGEIEAANQVLKRGWMTEGLEVEKFESKLKSMTHKKFALAVNSGTAALHLALLVMGISPFDEVIIPTFTCESLLQAVKYAGAVPVLVDVEKGSFSISRSMIRPKLSNKTKAIIIPHMFGIPADIAPIIALGIPVVEDCAQSFGSKYQNKPTGFLGNITIFSFKATKIVTTGQGGMILTNLKKYFDKLVKMMRYDDNPAYIQRFNYRMNDLSASIGNVQMDRLRTFIRRRRTIANRYRSVLAKQKRIVYWPQSDNPDINHFRFILQFPNGKDRNRAQKILADQGITSIVPVTRQQLLHRMLKFDSKDYPHSDYLSGVLLSLPIYPKLTDFEVSKITNFLKDL